MSIRRRWHRIGLGTVWVLLAIEVLGGGLVLSSATGREGPLPGWEGPPARLPAAGAVDNGVVLPDVPGAPSACVPGWSPATTPSGGPTVNFLSGATVRTARDGWVVGHYLSAGPGSPFRTLAEHWNGVSWTIVPTINLGSGHNFLAGVDSVSASDVWAVGYYEVAKTARSLAEHWNGSAWSVVPSPNVGSNHNYLSAVAAASPTEVWAVGRSFTGADMEQTMVQRWDGSSWSVVSTPNLGSGSNFLYGVAAADGEAWAVGYYSSDPADALQTLALRWDGSNWSSVATPNVGTGLNNVLLGVDITPDGQAWAVGYTDGENGLTPLVETWDGAAWSVVPNPVDLPAYARVFGVAVVSASDVWMAGSSGDGTFFLHWDGAVLSYVKGLPGVAKGGILGVAALPAGRAWAGGFAQAAGSASLPLVAQLCPISVTGAGFKPATSRVGQGTTVAWTFAQGNALPHTVTDSSGMGLFDSGMRDAGGSFVVDLPGAGGYPYLDQTSGASGKVTVPVLASPPSGGLATTFTVTWSDDKAPAGLVFDVQIRRPGAAWVDWKTDQGGRSATFTPDGGAGTYSFRARVRDEGTGAHSNWSPSASIVVT